jgi:hypothetical protein
MAEIPKKIKETVEDYVKNLNNEFINVFRVSAGSAPATGSPGRGETHNFYMKGFPKPIVSDTPSRSK